jgi:hypothetical protein
MVAAAEHPLQETMKRSLDLLDVVLLQLAQITMFDKGSNVGVADLDNGTPKAAGTPIAKPPLPDCFRGLARHADSFGS